MTCDRGLQTASEAANQPTNQPTILPASQPASQPACGITPLRHRHQRCCRQELGSEKTVDDCQGLNVLNVTLPAYWIKSGVSSRLLHGNPDVNILCLWSMFIFRCPKVLDCRFSQRFLRAHARTRAIVKRSACKVSFHWGAPKS